MKAINAEVASSVIDLNKTKCNKSEDSNRTIDQAHATNNIAVPARAASDKSNVRLDDAAPNVWTSNGDPPPEPSFESCEFGAAAAVDEAGG
jgi:hypothetical protein